MILRLTEAVLLFTVCISLDLVQCEWTGDEIRGIGGECALDRCFELPDDVRQYCGGYSHTFLPNSRGHTEIEQARNEFFQFEGLLISGCSEYIVPLLCFYYFPQSTCNDSSLTDSIISVIPCTRICEAVHASNCTRLLHQHQDNNINGWVDHLADCSASHFQPETTAIPDCSRVGIFKQDISKQDICVDDSILTTQPPKPETTTESPSCSEDNGPCRTTETPSERTTAEPPSEMTTVKPPTPKETTTVLPPTTTEPPRKKCTRVCKKRNKVSGKTYKQATNEYTFAIRVNVTGEKVGRSGYKVNVTKNYKLKSCQPDGVPDLPEDSEQTIFLPYEHCEGSAKLHDKTGKDLLISGIHSVNSDGTVTLKLGCENGNSLVAPISKMTQIKIDKLCKFVRDGNNERHKTCPQRITIDRRRNC